MPLSLQSARHDIPSDLAPGGHSPLRFFLLVFALSIPIWIAGALTGFQSLEGLSVSSLMTFCPLMAAMALTYRQSGAEDVKALLKRAFDYQRIRAKVWYVPIVLLMPGIMVLTYGLMRLMRLPLPSLQFPALTALVMFVVFFIAAIGEEVGWMGYAIDPMQQRQSALQAGVLLGLVGATWHIIPFVQTHRSLVWIACQCLFIVASRVLSVWIYNNIGNSVFGAILSHDISNMSTLLFPDLYDPRIVGPITAFMAAIVTVVWGPRTLARHRHA